MFFKEIRHIQSAIRSFLSLLREANNTIPDATGPELRSEF